MDVGSAPPVALAAPLRDDNDTAGANALVADASDARANKRDSLESRAVDTFSFRPPWLDPTTFCSDAMHRRPICRTTIPAMLNIEGSLRKGEASMQWPRRVTTSIGLLVRFWTLYRNKTLDSWFESTRNLCLWIESSVARVWKEARKEVVIGKIALSLRRSEGLDNRRRPNSCRQSSDSRVQNASNAHSAVDSTASTATSTSTSLSNRPFQNQESGATNTVVASLMVPPSHRL